jgi:hypothetical protein
MKSLLAGPRTRLSGYHPPALSMLCFVLSPLLASRSRYCRLKSLTSAEPPAIHTLSGHRLAASS